MDQLVRLITSRTGISEEAARQGIGPSLAYIVRSRELRETMLLIVVAGSAEEYIKRNKPSLELTIAKYYETMTTSASYSSYFLPVRFHDFYTRLKSAGGSPCAIYSGLNPMTGEDRPAGPRTPEQKGYPYLPGGVPRTGTENPVEFLGLAVFRGDKMVGTLDSDETRAVAILQGRFDRGAVGVVDPLKPEKDIINVNVRLDRKPKITADLKGGAPVFSVRVDLDADIRGVSSGINYEAPGYRELLEAQIANLFAGQIARMIKHTQELDVDPVGFGLYLRPKFRTTVELKEADLPALYRAADIRVAVAVRVRRTELLWRVSPAGKQ